MTPLVKHSRKVYAMPVLKQRTDIHMKIALRIFLACFGLSLVMPLFAHDDDPMVTAIKARQGEMQIRAHNLRPLIGMAKGKIAYDPQLASQLMGNLKLLLDLDTSRDWPQGSDNESYPDKSRALPNIWTTYPEIGEYAKDYAAAVNALNDVAGDGLGALQSKIGALGDSCKGCHDEYQKEH